MIRWMASYRVSGGNILSAMQYAKEIAEFCTKYDGISSVDVYLDAFGETGIIRWFVDYESLTAMDHVLEQIMADKAYWESLDQNSDLFIDGFAQTVVMRKI